jgi:NAD(P)H-quinone oxidoreductase subunit 5
LAAVVFGFLGAWGLYGSASKDPLPERLPAVCRVLRNKFYFDELYAWLIALTQDTMAKVANVCDQEIVSGLVRLVQGGTELAGRGLRLAQSGNIQTYTFLIAAGAAAALYFMLRH